MEIEKKIKQSLHDAFVNAIMKVNSQESILSDMYVQLKEDNNHTIVIYDDCDNVLIENELSNLGEWREGISDNDVVTRFAMLLQEVVEAPQLFDLFNNIDYNGPFSLLYVDENMDVIEELLNIDKDNIRLDDDFWSKMDRELDEFYEKLMSNIQYK